MKTYERRDILRLFGVSGVTFASGLWGCGAPMSAGPGAAVPGAEAASLSGTQAGGAPPPNEDFFFLQLSDTHWGFSGPPNPEADQTLRSTVATINAVGAQPDFIMFTGDLTHTTDDPAVRRARMKEFKSIVSELHVKDVRFIPGEHDASLDGGEAFREFFGETHYSFAHKGLYFIALDNVSDPGAIFGDKQLAWLEGEVAKVPANAPLVVFAHRPLFDLFPSWDWATKDGSKAIEILQKHEQVTVFYGHIHQEHHQQTGRIAHHAARSLVFPLPAPGSLPKKAPLPWDPQSADHGLGYREVDRAGSAVKLVEHPFARG
jgi:Calcineurin-like phosphoesterase